ncbi:MAG: hypothetical protein JXR63_13860 [Spirochaetales bacterium]|nr:hypothetical protein [Spirochaetales bacterium]
MKNHRRLKPFFYFIAVIILLIVIFSIIVAVLKINPVVSGGVDDTSGDLVVESENFDSNVNNTISLKQFKEGKEILYKSLLTSNLKPYTPALWCEYYILKYPKAKVFLSKQLESDFFFYPENLEVFILEILKDESGQKWCRLSDSVGVTGWIIYSSELFDQQKIFVLSDDLEIKQNEAVVLSHLPEIVRQGPILRLNSELELIDKLEWPGPCYSVNSLDGNLLLINVFIDYSNLFKIYNLNSQKLSSTIHGMPIYNSRKNLALAKSTIYLDPQVFLYEIRDDEFHLVFNYEFSVFEELTNLSWLSGDVAEIKIKSSGVDKTFHIVKERGNWFIDEIFL